ncbi:MAG: SRPBCC family protein [Actinomycetota bacterium]
MAQGEAVIDIDRTPDDVWALLRGFGTINEWMPGIDSCTVEGDVRTIGTMGIEIKEQLRELDEAARRTSYSVIASPMGNLESHLATISVTAEGSGSRVTWVVEVSPDELLGLFLPIYEGSVAELKKRLEA